MQRPPIRRTLANTYRSYSSHNCSTYAAGLAFFFFLSLFPFLIFLAAAVAQLPVPNLFDRILEMMSRVVPSAGMRVVHYFLKTTLQKNVGVLSVGILGAIWAASSGLHATMAALNVAYGVKESRSYWKTRLLAIGFAFLIGGMGVLALLAMVLGPRFGIWAASKIGLPSVFGVVWPYVRWTTILAFTILAVEVLYFLGPNVKQKFKAQMPGAMTAVLIWLGSSYAFSRYVHTLANLKKTYGALGAVIALMLWFQLSAVAILFGAELNAELSKTMNPPAEKAKAAAAGTSAA